MLELLIALSSLTLLGIISLGYLLWHLHRSMETLHDTVDTLVVGKVAEEGLAEIAPGEYAPSGESSPVAPNDDSLSQAKVTIADADTDIGTFRGAVKWQ